MEEPFLKAKAYKDGWTQSNVKTAIYCREKYSGGNGDPNNPYLIATKSDLLSIALWGDYTRHFKLTADIDLDPNLPGGQVFATAIIAPDTSSSDGFQGTAFTGTFDGDGHKITNFTIHGESYLGLFGEVDTNSMIKYLGIEGFSVIGAEGSFYIGGLAGYNDDGTINNCYSTGDIKGYDCVGGLAGQNRGNISNCYATGSVNGSYSVGGLVGGNYDNVSNSYSTGFVSGSSDVGGLMGHNDGTVTGSFWDTQTSGQTNSYGGTGKTTAQMKTLSTFTSAGWNFTTIWDICEGTNYPRLQWQIPDADWVCPDGVNLEDLNYLVGKWLLNNCTSTNNYCGGVDIDISGKVDLEDWAIFAGWWLEGV